MSIAGAEVLRDQGRRSVLCERIKGDHNSVVEKGARLLVSGYLSLNREGFDVACWQFEGGLSIIK